MKKIFGLILILIGGVLIGSGVFMQLSDKDLNTNKKDNKEKTQTLVRADTKGAPVTCNGELKSTYIQLNDYTKITFSYPDCIKERKLSYKTKQFRNEENDIKLDVTYYGGQTAKAYLNTNRTTLISWEEEDYYQDFDTSDIKEVKLDNVTYYYFNNTYHRTSMFDDSKMVVDNWYIAVPFKNSESNEERILTFNFTAQDNVIDSNTIDKMMRSIVIEEEKAEYIHSKEEGDYLVGSIKQNSYNSMDHGYIVNFKVPKDPPEVASTSTNIDTVVFTYEEPSESKYVAISLDDTYRTIKEEATSFNKIVADKKGDNYKNQKNSGVKYKKVGNYNVYYFITSYDAYHSETKKYLNTYYTAYAYVELSNNDFVELYFNYTKIPITEKEIEKYLNFTVEEF